MCSEIDEQRAKKGLSSRDIKVCGDRPCYEIVVETPKINKSSPLGQFRLGISLDMIQCKELHRLVIKTASTLPACVKVESVEKLRQREWAVSETRQQEIFEKLVKDRNVENIPAKTIRDFEATLSIPESQNLVAGANEAGYHIKNTNYGRDYTAEIVEDLVQAKGGDACKNCGTPLSIRSAVELASGKEYEFQNMLLALAEAYHDAKGLLLPHPAAPFDVYLMHVPGKEVDTRMRAEEIYTTLQAAGISVLFDDRDERAGVKFNDGDLIGCPFRVTAGEKALKEGMVELKPRQDGENQLVPVEGIVEAIHSLFK